ncbi:spermine oxidase-like [Euwallacea similis]|uniref:spermine oxidase-like n=1 Tax=Euwallacea similis TaxID=1736056 RepID=UPI00344C82FA
MAKDPKIVIIGAGASGIAAATKLFNHGFHDITILEAESRIGGRILSVEFAETVVDIGGQWVHGEKGNIIYDMVKDLDLITPSKLPDDQGMSFFLSDGTSPDKSLTDRLFALAMKVKDDKECAKRHGGSFASYFASEYQLRIAREFDKEDKNSWHLAHLVEQWFKKFIVLLNPAENWNQLSTTSHYVFQPCEGHQMFGWKNQGYKTIIDVMTRKNPNSQKQIDLEKLVIMNKEVTKIIWTGNKNAQVNIKCSDGSSYSGDHVIVTVSVGVLKEIYSTAFDPVLPDYKINSIRSIPLGTVDKLLLKFPHKWWADDMKDISFLWSIEEGEKLVKEFPHGPIVNGRFWLENLFSFIAIDSHPNILLAWINGPTAKLVEYLSDEFITKGAMFMLRKFAGKRFEIPEPDEILRSKWGSNPHFRGSYAYVSSKMEKSGASAEDLSKPLIVNGKPTVLFAGEATHGYLFSTVNGAMETGYREADRLIEFYRK